MNGKDVLPFGWESAGFNRPACILPQNHMSQLFPSRNLHEDAIEFVINYHDGHESILPELLMFGEHLVIELHGYDWEAIKYNGITYLMKKIK